LFSGLSYDEAVERESQIGSDKTTAAVIMGVGTAAALGSLAWKLLSGDEETAAAGGSDGAPIARVFMGPLGFGVRGSF
jgi:hypothetical protein